MKKYNNSTYESYLPKIVEFKNHFHPYNELFWLSVQRLNNSNRMLLKMYGRYHFASITIEYGSSPNKI